MTIRRLAVLIAALIFIAAQAPTVASADSALSTWSDSNTRSKIIDFVTKITTPGNPSFVPHEERIATFDMDGTVITEKPASTQKMIAMMQACVIATNEPKRTGQAPYKQACAKDHAYFPGLAGSQTLRDLAASQTQAAYRKYAKAALKLARHPGFGIPLGAMVYAPMIELARYLEKNGFQIFLVSGSTQPLVRELAELRFHLPRDHGIGTQWPLEFDSNPEGVPVFRWKTGGRRLPSVYGPGKPLAIQRHIGGPPIFAAGNTMGDLEMLQFATKSGRPGMGIVIVHDDAEREYAYPAPEIVAAAKANGWSLVSMKNDFNIVFIK
jgi:phosphoserine phosphatase